MLFLGGLGGTPRGVWGPRLADSRGPGASCAGPRGDPAKVPEKWPKQTFFWQFWGSGGYPQGSGAPGWQIPGTRSLLGRKVVLCRLSSNPYRGREAKCLLGALTSRRAAGTGREDPQPDNNPFQLRFCCDTHILCRVQREAESEKAPP